MPDLTAPSSPRPAPDGLPVLPFASAAALEAWLSEHGDSARGVWLRLARLESGEPSVTYPEVVELALRFGWVDGQKGADDPPWWRQRLTPRTARSRWSQVNRAAAQALLEAGRLAPGGLREVERAQADGRWEAAYPPASTAQVPDDLRAALDAVPAAARAYDGLDARNRYAVLHRVGSAKRVTTRARRIEELTRMLAEGRTPYPSRGTPTG